MTFLKLAEDLSLLSLASSHIIMKAHPGFITFTKIDSSKSYCR